MSESQTINSASQVYKNFSRANEDNMISHYTKVGMPEREARVLFTLLGAAGRVCILCGVKPKKLDQVSWGTEFQNSLYVHTAYVFKVFGKKADIDMVPEVQEIIDQDYPGILPSKQEQLSVMAITFCTEALARCGLSRPSILRYMGADMQIRESDKAIGRIMELFSEEPNIDVTRGGALPAMPPEIEDELTAMHVAITENQKETN